MNELEAAKLAIPFSMCTACGMTGRHRTPAECIDSLRDRIADLEFRVRRTPPTPNISRSRRAMPKLPIFPSPGGE